jgi:hypothetical protein
MTNPHDKAIEAAAIELRRITLGYCKPWEFVAESVKEVWRSRVRATLAVLGLDVGKACTVNKRLTKPVGPPTRRIRDGGW